MYIFLTDFYKFNAFSFVYFNRNEIPVLTTSNVRFDLVLLRTLIQYCKRDLHRVDPLKTP